MAGKKYVETKKSLIAGWPGCRPAPQLIISGHSISPPGIPWRSSTRRWKPCSSTRPVMLTRYSAISSPRIRRLLKMTIQTGSTGMTTHRECGGMVSNCRTRYFIQRRKLSGRTVRFAGAYANLLPDLLSLLTIHDYEKSLSGHCW